MEIKERVNKGKKNYQCQTRGSLTTRYIEGWRGHKDDSNITLRSHHLAI